MTVGRITQVYPYDAPFKRGDEKAVFRFGASAIVVAGEPDAWGPTEDILQNTESGVETFVRLGDTVATSAPATRVKGPAAPENARMT